MKKYLNYLLLPLFLLCGISANATHFNGGEITYVCTGFGKYDVTLELYQDCSSFLTFAPSLPIEAKAFNCNGAAGYGRTYTAVLSNTYEVSPICDGVISQTTCNGGSLPGVRVGVYTVSVEVLESCGDLTFYYSECCRANGNNIQSPQTTGLGLTAEQDNRDYFCNSNVNFLNSAIAFAQISQPFVFDPRGVDPDNDDIRYRLVTPLSSVTNQFTTPVTLNFGYTAQQPFPFAFTMDSLTGVIQTTPTAVGTYVVAYQVEEYRNGELIAKNLKEISVTVSDFGLINNTPPVYTIVNNTTVGTFINNTFRVCAGSPISFDIDVTDADLGDSVRVLNYGIDDLPGVPATFVTTGINPQTNTFNWIAPVSGASSYDLVFIVQDPNCPVVASHQYFRIRIEVAGALGISISDQFLCSSQTIDLSAGSGGTYLWSTGDTTGTITVDSAGIYSITTTDACGPVYASVEIFDEPQINIAGNNRDTAINLGDSLELATGIQTGPLGNRYYEMTTPTAIGMNTSTTFPLPVNSIFPTRMDSNSLVEICLDISGTRPDYLDIFLSAPDGSLFELSSGNGNNSIFDTYDRTCFSVDATDLITNYVGQGIPADSSFVPEDAWSDLYGRLAQGTWNLVVRKRFGLGGNGTLNSFSIQFGGAYDFLWTSSDPDGNISCTDCSNPIVYPDTITTYVVEMTNNLSCTTYDTITVYPRMQEPIDTLYFTIAEDSLLDFCVPVPAYMNASNTTTTIVSNTTAGSFLQSTNNPFCFSFLNFTPAQYTDQLVVAYCDNTGFCDTNVVYVTVASCVWAGDTDTNQLVNHFDLLPVGLGFGTTGTIRDNADINYDCEPSLFWAGQTPQSGANYKHADTDGNGVIDYADTTAIIQNWGQFYLKNSSSVRPNGTIPFFTKIWTAIPSQTVQIPIILGDTTNPADSVYGVAFTINYDSTKVKDGSVSVQFNSSWLGNINQDMMSISKNNHAAGQIDVALTRTDQMTRSGMGQIGTITMTIKDDIIKKSGLVRLNTHIDGVKAINNQEIEIGTTPVYTYVLITTVTDITKTEKAANLTIFPNPAQQLVQLQSDVALQSVAVINVAGQTVLSQPLNEVLGTQLDISKLTVGVYVLQIQTSQGSQQRRLVIQRP